MKISEIMGIEVSAQFGARYCLSWFTTDARYHVWLSPDRQMQGNELYKNPPEGVEYNGPGYFRTRHLKASDKVNRVALTYVMTEATRLDLFAFADRAKQRKDKQEATENRERARVHRQKEAGPALYAALKALFDHDYIITTGNHGYLRDAALDALAKVEG